ncbi:MAG: 50S ribosomal protein L10 [Candidatus Pacearchaeota archaeon]
MKTTKKMLEENKRNSALFSKKKKLLQQLLDLFKKSRTAMIISIQNISSSQLQKTKKELKDIAIIKVVKKSLIKRALQEAEQEKKGISGLIEGIEENYALLFSEKDAFEIAAILNKNKIPTKAKPNQIAPQDIVLEAGLTDLPAGPALSEIAKLGVKASVEEGKIAIKETKVIVKKGEKVTEEVASILSTLEINPFSLSLKPLIAYDLKELKLYKNIEVDPEKAIQEIKESFVKANALAFAINYICKETIKALIIKAFNNALVLSKNLKNQTE